MHDCRLLRGVLRSSRPANIPTLFTNAAAAWASVRGAELPPLALYGGVVLMGLCFYLYGMWALTAKTQDELTVSTVAFNHCEIQDDAIRLYGDGEKCYIIP